MQGWGTALSFCLHWVDTWYGSPVTDCGQVLSLGRSRLMALGVTGRSLSFREGFNAYRFTSPPLFSSVLPFRHRCRIQLISFGDVDWFTLPFGAGGCGPLWGPEIREPSCLAHRDKGEYFRKYACACEHHTDGVHLDCATNYAVNIPALVRFASSGWVLFCWWGPNSKIRSFIKTFGIPPPEY